MGPCNPASYKCKRGGGGGGGPFALGPAGPALDIWRPKAKRILAAPPSSLEGAFFGPGLDITPSDIIRHMEKWPIHRRSSCFFFQIEF